MDHWSVFPPDMRSPVKQFRLVTLFFLLTLFALLSPVSALGEKKAEHSGHIDPYESAYIHKFLKPGDYLPVDQIREGDTGYGLSVFHGTRVERFDVKVLGVMKQVLNGRDSILIRVSGEALGDNNVVRGMSGSPIYIKDKLVGALSYGFDFSKEPIVGVTPIVDMLDAIIEPGDQKLFRLQGKVNQELNISSIWGDEDGLENFRSALRANSTASGAPKMVPLVTPVALSGFSKRAQGFLAQKFRKAGLDVSGGGSGALNDALYNRNKEGADKLVPGSAVALMLSTGDFASVATGTVTGIFSNRVLAFGHPLMEAGVVDIPMGSAYIHDILPSLSVSFKLSSPLKLLGRIFADRPWSVGGELGKSARMVPVEITVIDDERHFRKQYKSSVINHPDFTSDLVSALIMSAMDSTFQSSHPYTVNLKSAIKVKDGMLIEREEDFASYASSSSGLSILGLKFFTDPVVNYVSTVVSKVYDNRFKKAEIESVKLQIKFAVGKKSTSIDRVIVENPVVEPGDKVRFECVLDPYNGEKFRRAFEFEVPRDIPDGDYMVGVAGGASYRSLRKNMKLFEPPSKSLEQSLERILEIPNSNELVALLALPGQAIHIEGAVIQNPPGHWTRLFFSDRYTKGPAVIPAERRFTQSLDSYVSGSHVVAFKVKRKSPYLQETSWFESGTGSGAGKSGSSYITGQAQKVISSMAKSSSSSSTSSSSGSSSSSGTAFASDLKGVHTRLVRAWNQSSDSSFSGGKRENCTIDSWGRLFPGFEEGPQHKVDSDVRAWSSTSDGGKFYFSTSKNIYSWSGGTDKPVRVASLDTTIVPAMASHGGRVYVACVPEGRVMVLDGAGGGAREFFRTPEQVISAMACDGDGKLYIGTAGKGCIYVVGSDGNLLRKVDSGQAHITSLNYSRNQSRMLVGTGENGNIYSLDSSGKFQAVYQSGAHIVTGATFDKSGNLLFTTAGPGTLYMVDPSGHAKNLATSEAFYHLFYDESSDSIFTGDAEGDVTQIQMEPLPERAFFVPVKHTNQEAVVSLTGDGDSNIFILTSNLPVVEKVRFRPQGKVCYTSTVKDAGRKAAWSKLRVYGAYNQFRPEVAAVLEVESRSGDTSRPDATWSSWRVAAATEDGFDLSSEPGRFFQYRLNWSKAIKVDDKDRVFPLGHDSVVGRVETTYLPRNDSPIMSSFNLVSGAYVSGEKELKLVSKDPDGDNMDLSVHISSDSGNSWKELEEGLRGSENKKEKKPKKSKSKDDSSKTMLKKKKTGKAKEEKAAGKDEAKEIEPGGNTGTQKEEIIETPGESSDEPKEEQESQTDQDPAPDTEPESDSQSQPGKADQASSSRKRIFLQSAGDAYAPVLQGSIVPSDKDKKKDKKDKKKEDSGKEKKSKASTSSLASDGHFEWTWDTKKHKDGIYMLRFRLSDAPSNGGSAGSATSNSFYRTVIIDNKSPTITNLQFKWSGGALSSLSFNASDKWSPVVNAVVESEKGESWALIPRQGLADGKSVEFIGKDLKFKKKPTSLKLHVYDQAGNKSKEEIKLK